MINQTYMEALEFCTVECLRSFKFWDGESFTSLEYVICEKGLLCMMLLVIEALPIYMLPW